MGWTAKHTRIFSNCTKRFSSSGFQTRSTEIRNIFIEKPRGSIGVVVWIEKKICRYLIAWRHEIWRVIEWCPIIDSNFGSAFCTLSSAFLIWNRVINICSTRRFCLVSYPRIPWHYPQNQWSFSSSFTCPTNDPVAMSILSLCVSSSVLSLTFNSLTNIGRVFWKTSYSSSKAGKSLKVGSKSNIYFHF